MCDPYGSEHCNGDNTSLSCENCEAISNAEVSKYDLRFPEIIIPRQETSYFCMTFDLPFDNDYHIIASAAILNNTYRNLIHKMVLYGCQSFDSVPISSPKLCKMGDFTGCTSIIIYWTYGQSVTCFGDTQGYRIGPNNYRRVHLEIHYNNPDLLQDIKDSSGLRLYYQPARPGVQDLDTFVTGQQLLEILPGQSAVEKIGTCPSVCTGAVIAHPVYVTGAINHMRYYGKAMKIEVFRGDAKIKDLTNDENFVYGSPRFHIHNPPFELRPGDEIRTTCLYDTSSANCTVPYGDSVTDEVCFGVLIFYPKEAILKPFTCVSKGLLSACNYYSGTPVGPCYWATFTRLSAEAQHVRDVTKYCSSDGSCRPECQQYLKTQKDNPCLQGDTFAIVKMELKTYGGGREFLKRITSCMLDQTEVCLVRNSSNGKKTLVAISNMFSLYIAAYLFFV